MYVPRRIASHLNFDRQLSVTEFQAAEQLWWNCVQQEAFSDDIVRLKAGQAVSSSSRLRQLSPGLDDHGVIFLEGRLDKAVGVAASAKHPVVLPPNHAFTRLLVHCYHVLAGHHGQATVFNELRQ